MHTWGLFWNLIHPKYPQYHSRQFYWRIRETSIRIIEDELWSPQRHQMVKACKENEEKAKEKAQGAGELSNPTNVLSDYEETWNYLRLEVEWHWLTLSSTPNYSSIFSYFPLWISLWIIYRNSCHSKTVANSNHYT